MGVVLRQVTLIALITEPPDLARVLAVIEEELREGLDAPKGVPGGRERTVVVAVDEEHRDALDAADVRAKANHWLAAVRVPEPRELVGKRRANALAWRCGARRFS